MFHRNQSSRPDRLVPKKPYDGRKFGVKVFKPRHSWTFVILSLLCVYARMYVADGWAGIAYTVIANTCVVTEADN